MEARKDYVLYCSVETIVRMFYNFHKNNPNLIIMKHPNKWTASIVKQVIKARLLHGIDKYFTTLK